MFFLILSYYFCQYNFSVLKKSETSKTTKLKKTKLYLKKMANLKLFFQSVLRNKHCRFLKKVQKVNLLLLCAALR